MSTTFLEKVAARKLDIALRNADETCAQLANLGAGLAAAAALLERGSNACRPCRACGVLLTWMRSSTGKPMPVEVSTHQPHWARCPDADLFRRRKAKAAQLDLFRGTP